MHDWIGQASDTLTANVSSDLPSGGEPGKTFRTKPLGSVTIGPNPSAPALVISLPITDFGGMLAVGVVPARGARQPGPWTCTISIVLSFKD